MGPEIIIGRIFDSIGFNTLGEELFHHMVISKLAFPLIELKTVEYLQRYKGAMEDTP